MDLPLSHYQRRLIYSMRTGNRTCVNYEEFGLYFLRELIVTNTLMKDSNCKKNSILFIHSYSFLGYNKLIFTSMSIEITLKEDYIYMGTIIIIGVMVAFLAAIFTAGYDDKPGVSKK